MNIVMNPPVPYWGRLPGGSLPGTMITIDGHPTTFARRFDINLVIGDNPHSHNTHNDIAFHFNPRFPDHYVVRNSRQNGAWQTEEWAPKKLPFHKGKPFSLMILVEVSGYKVAVDNQHFVSFNHRLPFELACLLNVNGDVAIDRITYHSANPAPGFGTPMTPSPHFVPGFPAAPALPSQGIQYSQSMGVQVMPPMPVMPAAQVFVSHNVPQVINHPALPFQQRIMGGLRPGHKVTIMGQPGIGFDNFGVEFLKGSTGDIALHFNPRNRERAVVRNAKLHQAWGREERDTTSFPFAYGHTFVLTIRVENNRYVFMINDQYFGDFHHRIQPLSMIDLMKIWGDVSITSVAISQDY